MLENLEQYRIGESDALLVCQGAQESQAAASALLRQCERQVLILTHDFEPGIYDNQECLEALEDLVLQGRQHVQVRFLIQQPALVAQRGHALLRLGRRMSSYIQMRCPAEQFRSLPHSFLLVDGVALLHRPYQDSFKLRANFKDPEAVRELTLEFEMLWHEAQEDPYLRTLVL